MAAFWCIDYGNGTQHNQYNSTSDIGQKLHASAFGLGILDGGAAVEGFRQFSFGRSTEQDGWQVNATLQKFKANFGAGLAAQFNIEIELDQRLSGAMEQASIL